MSIQRGYIQCLTAHPKIVKKKILPGWKGSYTVCVIFRNAPYVFSYAKNTVEGARNLTLYVSHINKPIPDE